MSRKHEYKYKYKFNFTRQTYANALVIEMVSLCMVIRYIFEYAPYDMACSKL